MKIVRPVSLIFLSLLLSGTVTFAQVTRNSQMVPSGKGYGVVAHGNAKPAHTNTCSNGICYHGGPLMLGTPHMYFIFYGSWTSTQQTYLQTFMKNLSSSPYEGINTTYYNGSGTHVSGAFSNNGAYATSEYLGNALSDSQIQRIVSDAISGGHLAKDSNGLYFVLTQKDVNETSGFCTQYCGWHTGGSILGSDIKYSFVGNPDRCPSACEEQTKAPSGDSGTSGMTSIMAHESEEAISDPDLNAWYDHRGEENADKCAWTFGTESTASNGSKYNITLGGVEYLIQRNWVNANGGFCAMSF